MNFIITNTYLKLWQNSIFNFFVNIIPVVIISKNRIINNTIIISYDGVYINSIYIIDIYVLHAIFTSFQILSNSLNLLFIVYHYFSLPYISFEVNMFFHFLCFILLKINL